MFNQIAGPWPMVELPASEVRDRAHRIALAEAKARPDPHRIEQPRLIERIVFAVKRQPARIDRALA